MFRAILYGTLFVLAAVVALPIWGGLLGLFMLIGASYAAAAFASGFIVWVVLCACIAIVHAAKQWRRARGTDPYNCRRMTREEFDRLIANANKARNAMTAVRAAR